MKMRTILLLACLLACAPAPAGEPPAGPPAKGDTPPPALGRDLAGNEVDLGALRGKVVMVSFWASWCGYCLKELPVLEALQERAGDGWLRIVAVNVQDDTPTYHAITRRMRNYRLTLTHDRSGRIARGYGVQNYPNLWIIDRQGRVWSHHVGYGEDSLKLIVGEVQALLQADERAQSAPGQG